MLGSVPATEKRGSATKAYAGLDFIRAAFCPLDFHATALRDHPRWAELRRDPALADLEIDDPLHYPRQFPYTDHHGNRKTGTQIVTAHFGLAPKDFDLFLGLYTYLKRLPELPADGRTYLTADFMAKQVGLPVDGQASYLRIRSRIFRLSYAKYTNSAFYNRDTQSYDIVNFGFFNLASMSRLTESRRPIVLEWDRSLFDLIRRGSHLAFDYELYRTLTPAMRRFYLIANRDGWRQRDSSIFIADDFAMNQIGYTERPEFRAQRMQKLKRLLADAADIGIIRPYAPWNGYMRQLTSGHRAGEFALRWMRGPVLKEKAETADTAPESLSAENDALFAQVSDVLDEHRERTSLATYRRLVSRFGRDLIQKHVLVVLAQKEHRPGSFQKSELATLINRLQHDHPEPDWYQDLRRAERLAQFTDVEPGQLSLNLYGTFFRE
jgi:hypothetical protein